jgi:asparagine synthetase B (glutamine-hydrolysing)
MSCWRAATRCATSSDTEVIVHLYEDLGDDVVRRRCAACSPSRSGTYAAPPAATSRAIAWGSSRCITGSTPAGWRFASELRALLAMPEFPPRVSRTPSRSI